MKTRFSAALLLLAGTVWCAHASAQPLQGGTPRQESRTASPKPETATKKKASKKTRQAKSAPKKKATAKKARKATGAKPPRG